MAAPSKYSSADYLAGLQGLMPRGRVWPRDADSVQTKLLGGFAPTLQRVDASGQQVLVDANPATTENMLPEWEETLGLPDKCLGATPTMEQRQASVRARFTAVGGETTQFLIDYAAALGYTITVTRNAPFRMGLDGMGDPIGDESWFFVLTINCATLDSILECELRGVAPAHNQLIFET